MTDGESELTSSKQSQLNSISTLSNIAPLPPVSSTFSPTSLYDLYITLRIAVSDWESGSLSLQVLRQKLASFSKLHSVMLSAHHDFVRYANYCVVKI